MNEPDVPIACTLSPGDLTDRRGLWNELSADITAIATIDAGFEVHYRATAPVTENLSALASAEATCCAFATWSVRDDGDGAVLSVTGPSDGVEALRAEFEQAG